MKERAYAKINLALNVKGVRDDGYHELEMIMVPTSFYDEIELQPSRFTTFSCNRPYIAFNGKNTMVKALEYMRKTYDINDHFKIHLNKFIPTRSGMAGGSADGAAIIRLLNERYQLNMDYEAKQKAALYVGADVFFCLMNKPALVKGIGEELEPFSFPWPFYVLLVKPKDGVSTKEAFDLMDVKTCPHPDVLALRQALIANDYPNILAHMANSLEPTSAALCPDIAIIRDDLEQMGFDKVIMSGSGSTLIAVSRNHNLIMRGLKKYRHRHFFAREVKLLRR